MVIQMMDNPDDDHVNFVQGPLGFTESFDDKTVDVMERMGLIEWVEDKQVIQKYTDEGWVGTGPITKFYRNPA